MATRVLALLAAVAMIAAALFVRARLDGDDGEDFAGPLKLVCDTALAAVCDAIAGEEGDRVEVRVEGAFTTFAALNGQVPQLDPYLDGWLVSAPWPGILAAARQRAAQDTTVFAGEILARSPVVMAIQDDRRQVLTERCGGEISWKCVGEVAGTAWASLPGGMPVWGPIRPAHPPAPSLIGLTVLGSAAVSFVGRTDLARADFEEPTFQDWFSRLEEAGPRPPAVEPFKTFLTRPTSFSLVGTIEADAGPALQVAASATKPVLLYPSPVVTADVVLAVRESPEGEALTRMLASSTARRALAAAGWRVEGEPRAPGVAAQPGLPPTSNLPDPDVLQALMDAAVRAAA